MSSSLSISTRQARSFTLSRQELTTPLGSPVDVARRLVAIQSQYLTSVPHSICARSQGLSRSDVERAICVEHSLVRTWCLRGTVHTLAATDLPLLVGAYGARRRARHAHTMQMHYGFSSKQLGKLERGILKALREGPVSRKELKRRVPEYAAVKGQGYGMDVAGLAAEGSIVFAPAIKGDTAFVLREQWLPQVKWAVPSEHDARTELARRYFAAHGPAGWADFRHWSGFNMQALGPIREAVEPELAEVTVKGWPTEQYVLRCDLNELAGHVPMLPKVKLLPKFDAVTLGYAHKTRWIDEAHLKCVYRIAAQVEAVLLVNGQMAGTWRLKPGKTLKATVEPFTPLSKSVLTQTEKECRKLGRFLESAGIEIEWHEPVA